MNHVSLDWTWANDCYFYNQIVKALRLEPWQHRLLGTAFNLENPYRIRPANHFIHGRIILWNIGKGKIEPIMFLCKIKGFTDTGKHSQSQHINFHKTKGIN